MNRRDLLTAAPAFGLAGLIAPIAAPAIAATETPIMAMFKEWQASTDWLNGPETDGLPDDEFDALVNVRTDLEDLMIAEPARSAADMLAKICAYTEFGEHELLSKNRLPDLWAEARDLLEDLA